MPAHQLSVSIALLALAACSLIVLVLSRPREGKIKLPEGDDSAESIHDPFDVTIPEDVVDGEPIGGPAFWKRVCPLISARKTKIDSQ